MTIENDTHWKIGLICYFEIFVLPGKTIELLLDVSDENRINNFLIICRYTGPTTIRCDRIHGVFVYN